MTRNEADDAEHREIIEFRLSCRPDKMMAVIERLQKEFDLQEVSDPYRNRNGQGVRVYVKATLKTHRETPE